MRLIENEDLGLLVLRNEDPPATTWRNCTIERVTILNCQLREPLRFEGCTFWSHGHFKTLTEQDALRGPAGRSPLGRSVVEELLKETVLSRHTISGVGKDAGLAVSKEAMPEVRAFLDNRVLGRLLSPVVNRLCDQWCK